MSDQDKSVLDDINVVNMKLFSFRESKVNSVSSNGMNKNKKHFFSLESYFLYGYYLAIVPFKPVYIKETGKWKMKAWFLQQIPICFCLIWIPCWINAITELPSVYLNLSKLAKVSAKAYFVSLLKLLHYIKLAIYSRGIHQCSEEIETHFNCIFNSKVHFPLTTNKYNSESKKSFRAKLLVVVITCAVYVTLMGAGFYGMLVLDNYGNISVFSSPKELFKTRILGGRQRFFMYAKRFEDNIQDFDIWDIVIGSLEIWLNFAHSWILLGLQTFFFACYPLTFWLATRNFSNYIDTHLVAHTQLVEQNHADRAKDLNYQSIVIAAFEEIQKFSDLLNSTWGVLYLFMVFENVMSTILTLNELQGSILFVTLAYSIMFFWLITMLASGDVYRVMVCVHSKLYAWTKQFVLLYGKYDPGTIRMETMLNDMASGSVGIGTYGVYRYDYSFMAQLLVVPIGLFVMSFDDDKQKNPK